MVLIPIIAIPLENEVSVVGFSVAKLTIFALLLAVLLYRLPQLVAACRHPVFLCGMAFLAWNTFCEALHPFPDWGFIYRVFQVLVFGCLIAAVSSNALVIRRVLISLSLVCSMLALYLVLNFYRGVSAPVVGLREAGRLREQALGGMSLATGLNIMGYMVGMGAVVALSRLLAATSNRLRVFWGGVFTLCAVGSFVPLSRGAFAALVVAELLVIARNLTQQLRPGKVLMVIAAVALLIFLLPPALMERYSILTSEQPATGKRVEDGRIKIYTAARESLPHYWILGVGAGNYWKRWAVQHGFGRMTQDGPVVVGPHNGFLAAWVYFGLPGLALLCLLCLVAARTCPRKDQSWESTAVFGLLGLGFMWLMFTHSLYLKPFSIILGLLVGISLKGAVNDRTKKKLRRRPSEKTSVVRYTGSRNLGVVPAK